MEKILIMENLAIGNHTANECMDIVYFDDLKQGVKRDTCRFYNHLNKHFAPLKKRGLITEVGTKKGPKGKDEKIWRLTEAGHNFLALIKAA